MKKINMQPNELPYFKIINTNELIDKYCTNRLTKILENENHAVTKNLINKRK